MRFLTLTLQTTIKYVLITLCGQPWQVFALMLWSKQKKWLIVPALEEVPCSDGIITPITPSSAVEELELITLT
jgi:K+ transporter